MPQQPSITDGAPPVTASVWLGSPQSADYFDPGTLSESDRQRYAQMRGTRRRAEFAASRALLADVLPGLDGTSSLSHSGGWAAVAHAPPGCRVGVDIERFRPRDVLGLAKFAFDPAEIEMLEAFDDSRRQRMFYALWTLKEAMAKALGVPLLAATRQCVFRVAGHQWQGTAPTSQPWRALSFQPRANIALAIVVIGNPLATSVSTLEWPPPRIVAWELSGDISNGAAF